MGKFTTSVKKFVQEVEYGKISFKLFNNLLFDDDDPNDYFALDRVVLVSVLVHTSL